MLSGRHGKFIKQLFLADLSRHGEMQDGAGEEREGLSGREGVKIDPSY